jgi:mono/diheme cytochrome c family protein
MMKRIAKIVGGTAVAIAALALILVVVVLVRADRTFDAPYPEVRATKDPAMIARGEAIAHGAGHCVNCHTPSDDDKAIAAGAMPPFTGGREFDLPFGKVYTPNLTPDVETGIGRRTDAELARVLRYGVHADGRAVLPFMEFHHLSDEDLSALISYLRAQKPIRNAVPKHQLNLIGKAVMAFAIKPIGPKTQPLQFTPAPEATIARGEYIANSVAGCAACHTKRNPLDGSFIGERFAGGMVFDDGGEKVLVSPNLTPSKYGRITSWSEDQFVGRFGAGVGIPNTHMPWRQYQRLSETDLRAIYRYLKSLPPVDVDPGPSVQVKKDA